MADEASLARSPATHLLLFLTGRGPIPGVGDPCSIRLQVFTDADEKTAVSHGDSCSFVGNLFFSLWKVLVFSLSLILNFTSLSLGVGI